MHELGLWSIYARSCYDGLFASELKDPHAQRIHFCGQMYLGQARCKHRMARRRSGSASPFTIDVSDPLLTRRTGGRRKRKGP